jgi:hypothetical protein
MQMSLDLMMGSLDKEELPSISPHPDLEIYIKGWSAISNLQEIANRHGVPDILQDGGAKTLKICLMLGLIPTGKKQGNDAHDIHGHPYEIKTADINRNWGGFGISAKLSIPILERYRGVHWVFSVYSGVTMLELYRVHKNMMGEHYEKWEKLILRSGKPFTTASPIVPFDWVREAGEKIDVRGALGVDTHTDRT